MATIADLRARYTRVHTRQYLYGKTPGCLYDKQWWKYERRKQAIWRELERKEAAQRAGRAKSFEGVNP